MSRSTALLHTGNLASLSATREADPSVLTEAVQLEISPVQSPNQNAFAFFTIMPGEKIKIELLLSTLYENDLRSTVNVY